MLTSLLKKYIYNSISAFILKKLKKFNYNKQFTGWKTKF